MKKSNQILFRNKVLKILHGKTKALDVFIAVPQFQTVLNEKDQGSSI